MAPRTRVTPTAVADALHSAAIHLLRRLRREDDRSGISAAKLSALSILVFRGPMRLTELAALEQVKPPTMSKLAAAMEREGLLRRGRDERDGRAVQLAATAQGTKILQEGRRRRVRLLAGALRDIGADELQALARSSELIDAVSRRL